MENTEQIYSLIDLFTITHFSNDLEEIKQIFAKVAEFYEKNPRHQYYKISKYVYGKMREEPDSMSYILNNIYQLQTVAKLNRNDYKEMLSSQDLKITCDDVLNSLGKLYDHIALEEERLINNDKSIRENEDHLQQNLVYNFNTMANNITEKFNDMSNGQTANIMTIVGLFAAIIFVFFGGVTGLSSVIKGIFEISKKEDLVIPFIIISFIGLVLFDIVFMLLYSISKILNKNIGRVTYYNIYATYWYEKEGDCFYIKQNFVGIVSCTNKESKAKRICLIKNIIPKLRKIMRGVLNVIVLRYPMVFLFNAIGIGLIIYLISKL